MGIAIKINKLGSLENATIELKPFTIFFGKQATFKSYTLISIYGLFKMLEDVFYSGLQASYEKEELFSRFLKLVKYEEKIEEIDIPMPEGQSLKVKEKKLVFKANDLIEAFKKLYKDYIPAFFNYMLNYVPEHDIGLEISLEKEVQELWITIINESSSQYTLSKYILSLKYMNGEIEDKEFSHIFPQRILDEIDSEKFIKEFAIRESLESFFKEKVLGKNYSDLSFLSPNRIDVVDMERLLSISLVLPLEEFLRSFTIPGIVKETVLTYHRYNPTGMIFIAKNNDFPQYEGFFYNLLDKGSLEFRKTDKGIEGLFYLTKEGKGIPIHATATSIKQLSLLYLFLRYENSTDKKVLFMEEPEMNLHPELQMRLAGLFSRIVHKGGWVFLTTHSDYFTLTLSSLIRIKYLKNKSEKLEEKLKELGLSIEEIPNIEDLGIYLFKKENDKVFVERIYPSPEEGIPKDSFDETLNELYKLIKYSYGEFESD